MIEPHSAQLGASPCAWKARVRVFEKISGIPLELPPPLAFPFEWPLPLPFACAWPFECSVSTSGTRVASVG